MVILILEISIQTIDELNEKYHQSKQIFKSFEQYGLNHLCKNVFFMYETFGKFNRNFHV